MYGILVSVVHHVDMVVVYGFVIVADVVNVQGIVHVADFVDVYGVVVVTDVDAVVAVNGVVADVDVGNFCGLIKTSDQGSVISCQHGSESNCFIFFADDHMKFKNLTQCV